MSGKNRKDELDEFWDIDGLMPAKRPAVQRKAGATDAALIEVDSDKKQKQDDSQAKLSRTAPVRKPRSPEAPPEPEAVWDMQGGLVHRVAVYPWKSHYTYYEKFCRDGEYLRKIIGKPAEQVGFFSYMPQYGQMSKQQLAYYLWWRENIRSNDVYLPADYSYILLNMYELINLHSPDPARTLESLCQLWLHYKKDAPRLDRYFAEWICDYCLLHGLRAPVHTLAPIMDDVLAVATLKEFYLDCGEDGGDTLSYAKALLRFCCQYDYRKSKFATGENKELYDKLIPGVLEHLLEKGGAGAALLRGKGGMQEAVISRDSFVAALCSHHIKKRFEVHYCSVSRSHELRFAVTDMVKYTENRIRAHMGVKSRLSVSTLTDAVKREMDEYLDGVVPRIRNRVQEEVEQYEKLYDLPVTPLDLSRSAEIEKESWETTQKLVEAFEDAAAEPVPVGDDVPDAPKTPEPMPVGGDVPDAPKTPEPMPVGGDVPDAPKSPDPKQASEQGTDDPLKVALADYLPFIAAVAAEDAQAQRAAAKALGRMADAVADEINEIATEVFGDVILEDGADGYVIIEDYREQLSSLWRE